MKKYLLLVIIPFVFSCKTYQQVSLSGNDLLSRQDIVWKFNKYNVYVHDNNSSARLLNPEIKDSTIHGNLQAISPVEASAIINPKKRQTKKHRGDLHLYVNDLKLDEASADSTHTSTSLTKIEKMDIQQVKMYALNKQESFGYVLLIILAVLVGIALLFLLILLFTNAMNDASNDSSGDSNSNSDSNSDSGDSSGGSSGNK